MYLTTYIMVKSIHDWDLQSGFLNSYIIAWQKNASLSLL